MIDDSSETADPNSTVAIVSCVTGKLYEGDVEDQGVLVDQAEEDDATAIHQAVLDAMANLPQLISGEEEGEDGD